MSSTPKPQKLGFRQRIGRWLHQSQERKEPAPSFLTVQNQGEIERVFTCGGTDYFRFINEQRVPTLRAFAAKDVWAELTFRTTREHLRGTLRAAIKLMNRGENIQAGVLLDTMDQRLDYITHTDLLYKLASVLYFDQYENVLDYDPVYNASKIKRWQTDMELDAFFLQTPMIELLPFGDLSKIDFQAFTEALRKADLSHLKAVSSILSSGKEPDDLATFLTSQAEILSSLIR